MSARWRSPALWLGVASAALVVLFVVADADRVSPGPISAVHAQLDATSDGDCASCHGGFASSMRSACASCHEEIEAQIAQERGFHGAFLDDASSCGRCHVEHHGRDVQIAGAQAFALAGVPDRDRFGHEKLGFALEGAHLAVACRECHPNADATSLTKGTTRFGGLEQRCTACHDDPHAGEMPDCASCHGQSEPFASAAEFEHTRAFLLEGSHAGHGCETCHAKDGEHAIGAYIARRGTPVEVRDCAACHDSPHSSTFVGALAATLGVRPGASCAACHPPSDETFARPQAEITAAQHALSGFALDAPHAAATCEQCHSPNALGNARSASGSATDSDVSADSAARAAFAALHPGRRADDCAACHVDPHGGQFAGASCLTCHERLAFQPHGFDVARHASTAFALEGAHAAVACEACHSKASLEAPRAFHGTSSACASCHADAHRGFFAQHAPPALAARAEDCASCHSTLTFADERSRGFDHAAWTGFALVGEHATTACEACHPRRATPDELGRSSTPVASRVAGPPQACASCHFDVHAGFFDGDGGAEVDVLGGRPVPDASASAPRDTARALAGDPISAAKTECASCHTPHGFDVAKERFDHAARTRFALTGAHERASCETCHTGLTPPDAQGQRFRALVGRGKGSFDDCRTCHADPHGGAFDRGSARSSCAECHTTESFQAARESFDHGARTGFALDGSHSAVACQSCHAALSTPLANGRAFARAAGTNCADCHVDPHVGQFAIDGATSCARCHTTASTFDALTFDHARDSRFALDATHAKLDCAACHVPASLPDGTRAVRYKPLGTSCGDCHDPRGAREGLPR